MNGGSPKFTAKPATKESLETQAEAFRGQGEVLEVLAVRSGIPKALLSRKGPARKPRAFMTDHGSVYQYLPNGKTERFKTATGERHPEQDILIFIPPWRILEEEAKKIYPNLAGIDNETIFHEALLEFVHKKDKFSGVIDENGKELFSNAEIVKAKQAYLACFDMQNSKQDFKLPVGRYPAPGWFTYDSRFCEQDGKKIRKSHIGNKVTQVEY